VNKLHRAFRRGCALAANHGASSKRSVSSAKPSAQAAPAESLWIKGFLARIEKCAIQSGPILLASGAAAGGWETWASLGREGKATADAPPAGGFALPPDAFNAGQSDDDQAFLLARWALLVFMLSRKCLQQVEQTVLMLSAKSSSAPSELAVSSLRSFREAHAESRDTPPHS
jgi:hypothetical protein